MKPERSRRDVQVRVAGDTEGDTKVELRRWNGEEWLRKGGAVDIQAERRDMKEGRANCRRRLS